MVPITVAPAVGRAVVDRPLGARQAYGGVVAVPSRPVATRVAPRLGRQANPIQVAPPTCPETFPDVLRQAEATTNGMEEVVAPARDPPAVLAVPSGVVILHPASLVPHVAIPDVVVQVGHPVGHPSASPGLAVPQTEEDKVDPVVKVGRPVERPLGTPAPAVPSSPVAVDAANASDASRSRDNDPAVDLDAPSAMAIMAIVGAALRLRLDAASVILRLVGPMRPNVVVALPVPSLAFVANTEAEGPAGLGIAGQTSSTFLLAIQVTSGHASPGLALEGLTEVPNEMAVPPAPMAFPFEALAVVPFHGARLATPDRAYSRRPWTFGKLGLDLPRPACD